MWGLTQKELARGSSIDPSTLACQKGVRGHPSSKLMLRVRSLNYAYGKSGHIAN